MGDKPSTLFDDRGFEHKKSGLVMGHGWKQEFYDMGHIPTARNGEEFIRGIDE